MFWPCSIPCLNNCCTDAKSGNLFLDVLNNEVNPSIKDIGLK